MRKEQKPTLILYVKIQNVISRHWFEIGYQRGMGVDRCQLLQEPDVLSTLYWLLSLYILHDPCWPFHVRMQRFLLLQTQLWKFENLTLSPLISQDVLHYAAPKHQ
jgi:hypothetical protein